MTKPNETKPAKAASKSIEGELSDKDLNQVSGGAKPAWAGGPTSNPNPGPLKPALIRGQTRKP